MHTEVYENLRDREKTQVAEKAEESDAAEDAQDAEGQRRDAVSNPVRLRRNQRYGNSSSLGALLLCVYPHIVDLPIPRAQDRSGDGPVRSFFWVFQ